MSDAEENTVEQVEEPAATEPAEEPKLDLKTAIQRLLKSARIHGKMYRGLRESAKALDRNEAALCILAKNCTEPAYTKLVTALCQRRDLPIVQVEDAHDLGEWAGLCQIDKDGNPRKVVKCSCVVIAEPGNDYDSYEFISNYLKEESTDSE